MNNWLARGETPQCPCILVLMLACEQKSYDGIYTSTRLLYIVKEQKNVPMFKHIEIITLKMDFVVMVMKRIHPILFDVLQNSLIQRTRQLVFVST